jgi:hypothetical protein
MGNGGSRRSMHPVGRNALAIHVARIDPAFRNERS